MSVSIHTPATRTGPPRSLSFVASSPSRIPQEEPEELDLSFRGALEYTSPKGKTRREKSTTSEEIQTPKKLFHEPPEEEKVDLSFPESEPPPQELPQSFSRRPTTVASSSTKTVLRRAFSAPHPPTETSPRNGKEKDTSRGRAKWAKLRSFLPHIIYPNQSIFPGPSVVTSHAVNITDELITGGLSTLMLRLWLERDEKGHRRVPVLFHRLRIRVSDSLHPLQQHKSVFRIECEYANGAARWVIYRELRDFISLHAHYTVSNVYNRIKEKLPEFPMTSGCLIFIPRF